MGARKKTPSSAKPLTREFVVSFPMPPGLTVPAAVEAIRVSVSGGVRLLRGDKSEEFGDEMDPFARVDTARIKVRLAPPKTRSSD